MVALTFLATGFSRVLHTAFAVCSLIIAKFISESIKRTRQENQVLKQVIVKGKLENPVSLLSVLHGVSKSMSITEALEALGRLIGKYRVRVHGLIAVEVRANAPFLK